MQLRPASTANGKIRLRYWSCERHYSVYLLSLQKTLEDVSNEQDMWTYIQVAVVNGVWVPSTYPDTQTVFKAKSKPSKREQAYVRKFNVNLGVLVTQERRRP